MCLSRCVHIMTWGVGVPAGRRCPGAAAPGLCAPRLPCLHSLHGVQTAFLLEKHPNKVPPDRGDPWDKGKTEREQRGQPGRLHRGGGIASETRMTRVRSALGGQAETVANKEGSGAKAQGQVFHKPQCLSTVSTRGGAHGRVTISA